MHNSLRAYLREGRVLREAFYDQILHTGAALTTTLVLLLVLLFLTLETNR